ncbi:unnamed protein product [Cutaneotrichosporon oleaginosum]
MRLVHVALFIAFTIIYTSVIAASTPDINSNAPRSPTFLHRHPRRNSSFNPSVDMAIVHPRSDSDPHSPPSRPRSASPPHAAHAAHNPLPLLPRSNAEALQLGLPLLHPHRRPTADQPKSPCPSSIPCQSQPLLDLGGDCSLELRVPNGALALACRLEIALGVAVRADIGLATCLSFDPNIGVVCGNGVGLSHFDSACGQCEMHEWPRMQCICNNRLVDFAVGTFCSSSMVSLRRLR